MKELTEQQRQVLAVIQRSIRESGMPPTRWEIAKAFGFKSSNAAEQHMRALERKGYIELIPNTARGIRLLEKDVMDELTKMGEAIGDYE